MRSSISSAPVAVLALVLAAGACAQEDEGLAPPLASLHFPTGLSLAPPRPDGRELLFVVSSNFDLRYRSGVLHVLDRAAIDRLADEAPIPAGCPLGPDGQPVRCRTPEVPDLTAALVGAVEIGDLAGSVDVAALPDRLRAFVPIRAGDRVLAVDVPDGAPPGCAQGGGILCADATVSFPGEDPFSVRVVDQGVYVSHVSAFDERVFLGAAPVDAPIWTAGGEMPAVVLGRDAGGGGIAARCEPVAAGEPPCTAGGTLFVSGRSFEDFSSPVYVLELPPGGLAEGPVSTIDLFSEQRGIDSRGLAVSSDGDFLYLVTRFPLGGGGAVAFLDVSRLPAFGSDGCAVIGPPPPGFVCPTEGIPVPELQTTALVPSPTGPTELAVIPRPLPGGGTSDLVVVAASEALGIVDTRTSVLAAALDGLGSAPSAVAWRPLGDGIRLYVTSFGRGTLAVLDMPDPFRPWEVEVVALLGGVQEGSF